MGRLELDEEDHVRRQAEEVQDERLLRQAMLELERQERRAEAWTRTPEMTAWWTL
jgi:hypothetical protein